jgi:hypothetical protein
VRTGLTIYGPSSFSLGFTFWAETVHFHFVTMQAVRSAALPLVYVPHYPVPLHHLLVEIGPEGWTPTQQPPERFPFHFSRFTTPKLL